MRKTSKETSPTQPEWKHEERRLRELWEREEATGQSKSLRAEFQEKGPVSCELKELQLQSTSQGG